MRGLEQLLDSTASPNTLLRPKFWRMSPARFWRGFSTQFLGPGSADEVGSKCLLELHNHALTFMTLLGGYGKQAHKHSR